MKRLFLLLSVVSFVSTVTYSQVVYEPMTNNGVYELLDELATLKIISINSVVKPYSRVYIAEKLLEAKEYVSGSKSQVSGSKFKVQGSKKYQLNKRQIQEIDFYLRDYNFELGIQSSKFKVQSSKSQDSGFKSQVSSSKLQTDTSNLKPETCNVKPETSTSSCILHPASFSYDPISFNLQTKVFRMSLRPAFGARYIVNENGHVWDVTGGGEVFGYIGKHVGYYFNVKQTWQSEALVKPEYFTLEEGKVWRDAGNGSVANTEWKGGVSVAWKWGDFGVYKDRPIWGNGVHGSNILSGHAPPFPFIQLHVKPAKWIEFRYIHGRLKTDEPGLNPFSEDSAYASYCQGHSKYIAANMLTVTPWKGLDLSVGNSIIYSDVNPSPFMLIPFMFFNPVDNERTAYNDHASSNSQIFASISSRQIRHLHLFVTLYIDELKVSRIIPTDQYNFTSWKAGFTLWDLPVKNLNFSFEWTYTKPITYKHYVVATNFNNDSYNMGDWMRDNAQVFFASLGYRPIRGLWLAVSYLFSEHGTEYPYMHTRGKDVTRFPVLTDLAWVNSSLTAEVTYQIFSNASVRFRYIFSERKGDIGYDSQFMHGKTNTIEAAIRVGL